MASYDSIIIGAGHNGLVCAGILARSGQRVLVLEASETTGGLAATREFHPGFSASVAHVANHFPKRLIDKLNLSEHGLNIEPRMPLLGLSLNGKPVSIDENEVHGVTEEDKIAYAQYSKKMQEFAQALEPFWLKTIPRIGQSSLAEILTFGHIGLKLRLMGKDSMREFLRVFSLPMRDLMDEYFESDVLKSMLSWDGLIGSKSAPRSPNNSVLTLLYRLAASTEACTVKNLIDALQASALAAGAEIRTGTHVERLDISGDHSGLRTRGVILSDGEILQADRVISSADPQSTFLKLVGVQNLEIGFSNRIKRLRCKGYVAKMHLALSSLPDFRGLDQPAGRMIIAPRLDAIEYAFDDAKYGAFSADPVMEVTVPSMTNPSLAPDGQHVLSAHVMYVPHELKGGWDETTRTKLSERIINTLSEYAPDIRQSIVAQELLTPRDLEHQHGVTGGHWHHAEIALDQMLMMRPTYEAAQYSTPIAGLYLCGAGCHPGGDLTGAAGHNAALEILK